MSDTAAEAAVDVAFVRRWMSQLAHALEAGCDELTRLDAAVGDADHGINMVRGMRAVMAAIESDDRADSPAGILSLAGSRLVTVVGGAAGPLYGGAFRSMAAALEGRSRLELRDVAAGLAAGLDAIQRMGAAVPGDKTIVDAWQPAVVALTAEPGDSLVAALARAEQAAEEGMVATTPMRARKGRASYLGWRSEGHQDPGATSARLVFSSLVAAVD